MDSDHKLAVMVTALIVAFFALLTVVCADCSEKVDKERIQCVQAGRDPEACARAFHN